MEENILNNIDMTQGVTPEGAQVDNTPMVDLTDIIKTRFENGEPALDILVDLIMQGIEPNQMGMAFEEIGFDPASYTQLLQDAEIKLQGIQQQAQAQQQMQQQQMPEQSAQPLPPVSEEELLAESERAAREIESQDQPQPMQYGSETTSYATGRPTPLYIPPIPRRGNLLGASLMLADAADQFFTNKDRNSDGVMDGTFRDWSAKNARYKDKQFKNRSYKIKYGDSDPDDFVITKQGLLNEKLETKDEFANNLGKYSLLDFDPKTGSYLGTLATSPEAYDMLGIKDKEKLGLIGGKKEFNIKDPKSWFGREDAPLNRASSLERFVENLSNQDDIDLQMIKEAMKYGPGKGLNSNRSSYDESTLKSGQIKDARSNYRDIMMGNQPMSFDYPMYNPMVPKEQEEKPLSFKDWALQDPVTRMGANAQLEYNNYLDNFGSSFRYGGSTLPKAQWGGFGDLFDAVYDATDSGLRSIGNAINYIGGGDDDYWDDPDRTFSKETANLDALLTSPKNWVWTDDDGYEPLPNYNQYANKDEAFAAARKNLGKGKSFLYDGIRYTTNYKDEAPNNETEEILKRVTKDLSKEETERFREVWRRAGQPPLTFDLDDERYSIPAYDAGWLDFATGSNRRRAHVNLINRDNKVYLGREGMTDEQVFEKILDELSHNMQIRRDGTATSLIRFGAGGLKEWMNPEYEPYDDTSAFEGEAHEVIAPKLIDYVYKGGDFPEFKYGAELPKAQMMGEFDPNNPYGIPDFSQMGQTSYINPDTGMPYDMDAPLAANQGNPIMLDEATVTAPAMEGLQSKALTEIPIEMPEMNLAPIDFSRFQSPGVDLQSKALTEIPIETPEMKMASINLTPPTPEQSNAEPEVKRKRGVSNAINQVETFIKENPYMRAYGDISDFAVKGANLVNEYFTEKEFMDYKNKLRNFTSADKVYRATIDPVNKRGTFDINTGLAEPDNLVDYYAQAMYGTEMYKKGGEFEPHMMYDPETGKGYKANKPADHERMAKMGYTHELPKAMFGMPILGLPGMNSLPTGAGGNINKSIQRVKEDPISFARFMSGDMSQAGKFIRFSEQGGEVEVDNDTLAALIAAGADIEML